MCWRDCSQLVSDTDIIGAILLVLSEQHFGTSVLISYRSLSFAKESGDRRNGPSPQAGVKYVFCS